MMNSGGRTMRFPFTASQWQELEHQALVYKYMSSGMPIPPDLLFTIRRSLDSSMSSKFLIHQPQMGWNGFQMGYGRKIDPEPGRCRRTDGKKWRCSKEAYTDSKYCERHMHRGRNRSRKPVEFLNHTANNTIPIISPTKASSPPNAIPITKNTESHFLYPHFTPSRPSTAGIGLSFPQESSTNFNFLEPNSYSHAPTKDYGHVMKVENSSDDHHLYFSSSEASSNSGTMRNDSCWQLSPLTMGSPVSQIKQSHYNNNATNKPYSSVLQSGQHFLHHNNDKQHGHQYLNIDREDEPKKVNMHHFLDEWTPKDKDSWLNSSSDLDNKLSTHGTTHHSLHDFFMTQK